MFFANKLTLVGNILLHTFHTKFFKVGGAFRFHKAFQIPPAYPVLELSPLD
jgi:hypothetical protein